MPTAVKPLIITDNQYSQGCLVFGCSFSPQQAFNVLECVSLTWMSIIKLLICITTGQMYVQVKDVEKELVTKATGPDN